MIDSLQELIALAIVIAASALVAKLLLFFVT